MENVDIFGRQYSQLITYDQALAKFKRYLKFAQEGATPVYEVRSFELNNVFGVKLALEQVPKGAVVWQHTDKWHTAAVYIKSGHGHKFNRKALNLFSHGVTSEAEFERAWINTNGEYERGVFPKSPGDYTAGVRRQQESYIVAAKNYPENKNSKIPGSLKKNIPHRTHLISAQTTGIESHKGLLIDFDGWLNMNPMNQFEIGILDLSDQQDIIWTVNIWIDPKDHWLHWHYQMYDSQYNLIAQKEWIDDRWVYIWRYDKGKQDKLT